MSVAATATAPALDHITVPGAGEQTGRSVNIGVSCELMKNQLPGTDITATTDTAVVQDASGAPMIFTIGSDGHLRLLTMASPTATGFTVIDLMAGFPGYQATTAFDVVQDQTGRISLAAALTRADGSGTDVVIMGPVSDDLAKTDWAAFGRLAVKVTGIASTFTGSRIQMGSTDGGNTPFTIIVGTIGGEDFYYRVDGPQSPATELEFPENVLAEKTQVDLSIGFAFGDRATWFLYSTGEGQTLEATTLPADGGKSLTYDYGPGQGSIPADLQYTCMATPTGANTDSFSVSSDVYVGTESGVYLFQGARTASIATVTDQLKDVHELTVTQDEESISVWAVCSPNELYYIYGKKGPTYTWNAPILFNPSVIHVAPIRSRLRRANERTSVGSSPAPCKAPKTM
jgi:hypothetical protein